MADLSAFIYDRRYSVPTLRLGLMAQGEAREIAERLLAESAHYQAVELRDGDELLLRLDATARAVAEGAADEPTQDPGGRS